MTARKRSAFAAGMCVSMLAVAGHAWGDIYNGDFEATPALDDWFVSAAAPNYVQDETTADSTVAHLHAEATYTSDDIQWNGAHGQASLIQGAASGVTVSVAAGETQLSFAARAVLDGDDLDDPKLTLFADGGLTETWTAYVTSDVWTMYVIELKEDAGGYVPAGTTLDLFFQASTRPPVVVDPSGTEVMATVGLYLDNVALVERGRRRQRRRRPGWDDDQLDLLSQITARPPADVGPRVAEAAAVMYLDNAALVPEPASLMLVCLAIAAVRRRR